MLLKDLAQLFSNQISQWPVASPSKALPFYIKILLKNTWGKKYSSNDFNQKVSPNRFGVFTRNFQLGDPLKTLSRSHLLRLNLFVTKMDISPGRKNILVLFHRYENMTFQSESSLVNKGQMANGVCALLEEVHKSLGQNFRIKTLEGKNFLEECLKFSHFIRRSEKVYFISDFLFQTEKLEASAEEVLNMIKYFNLKNNIFFALRDPLECVDSENQKETYELSPWIQNSSNEKENRSTNLYGDQKYFENIKKQMIGLEENIQESQNQCKLLTASSSLDEILKLIVC